MRRKRKRERPCVHSMDNLWGLSKTKQKKKHLLLIYLLIKNYISMHPHSCSLTKKLIALLISSKLWEIKKQRQGP